MKIIVALAVIALGVIQLASGYGALDTLRAGIARQKIGVQSTLNRLERHSRDFSYNLNNKLSDAKINSMQQINSIVNPTLKNIEDATKKSTAEGKDATQCYEAARASLREYSLTGFSDLDGCRNEALSSVSATKDNMDSTVLAGRQVVTYLDSIFPSCFAANMQQMESCVVGMLPEGTQLARTFQSTAETVMNSSGSVASTAQVNAINCNRGPVSNVREGATGAQVEANRCVAAL